MDLHVKDIKNSKISSVLCRRLSIWPQLTQKYRKFSNKKIYKKNFKTYPKADFKQ